jgi:hypothetical protein
LGEDPYDVAIPDALPVSKRAKISASVLIEAASSGGSARSCKVLNVDLAKVDGVLLGMMLARLCV